MKNEITGGVSPLKGRRRSSKKSTSKKGGKGLLITGGGRRRGGSAEKYAGTNSKFAGGFGRSTATTNMAARTKNTKYRIPDKKQFPSSGGGDNTSNPPPQKPFGWTPQGGFDFDFSDMVNVKINNANQQSGGGLEEEVTEEEVTTTEDKAGKSGNEFADNCYDKDGGKREGHIFYSNLKKMRILCKWGGKSDGSFNYKTEGSSSSSTSTKTTTKKKKSGGKGNKLTQTNL